MRLIYGAFGAVVLAVVIAGCGGSGSGGYTNPGPTPTPTPTPGGNTVSIVGQAGNRSFNPNPAALSSDGKMIFSNADGTTHRIVANDGSWDTGNLGAGATSAAVSVPAGGSNYHCSIHPSMVGVINNSAGATPPCTGLYC